MKEAKTFLSQSTTTITHRACRVVKNSSEWGKTDMLKWFIICAIQDGDLRSVLYHNIFRHALWLETYLNSLDLRLFQVTWQNNLESILMAYVCKKFGYSWINLTGCSCLKHLELNPWYTGPSVVFMKCIGASWSALLNIVINNNANVIS